MAGDDDGIAAPRGALRHSLELGAATLGIGLAVVFALDLGTAPATAPVSSPASTRPVAPPTSELVLTAGAHGHFTVEAVVNGVSITFLLDTGASAIYLTPEDAARLGWTAQRLTYSERYATASGVVRAAPVTLRSLRIGELEFYDLPASVGEQPAAISLLGMSFLKRFARYEVRGDRLILAW